MRSFLPFARAVLGLSLATSVIGCDPAPDNTDDTTSGVDCSAGFCVLSGTITENLTLTADQVWLLRGGVFIGNDVDETVLTIEPGTVIYGESSTNGMLAVTRGSKILAEGTADAPIVFTSSKEEGERARGDWGGLIINGRAPVNGCDTAPCESFGEGGTGYYGGGIADDDSGVLKYVRVEFAGRLISPDNELNGIAFQGVGSGTTVDFIQVHMGKDDCIEFFGGTVNAKHILCTGIADDNLDWTDGWTGKVQYFIAQQYDDAGDNGFEGDNNAEANTSLPRSMPTIANATLIGSDGSEFSDLGMLIREGSGAHIANTVVMGWGDACLDVDHLETFTNAGTAEAPSGNLRFEGMVFSCATVFEMNDEDFTGDDVEDADPFSVEAFVGGFDGNVTGAPGIKSPYSPQGRDFRPEPGSLAASGAVVVDDPFFDVVDFRGAMSPGDDWTFGWTTSALD